MTVSAFLAELRSRDIRFWADGDRLRCNAPAGVLTPELRDQLRQRKSEILEFLRMAESLAGQQGAVVPMQPRGMHTPVFAVGGHNGDVFAFRDLARHLGDDQPFFGMHPPGLDGDSEPLERVEDLAEYFAEQIRAFRPNGPYIIVGYCAGGAIALELARRLLQRGADVSFLALFGCPYPRWYRFPASLPYWGKRLIMHAQVLATLSSFAERRQYLAERLRRRVEAVRAEASPAGSDALSVVKFKFEQATMAAVRRYTPRRFSGRICHFIPNRAWLRPDDARQGWRCPGGQRWRSVAPHIEEYYGPESVDAARMLIEADAPVFAELFRQARDAAGLKAAVRAGFRGGGSGRRQKGDATSGLKMFKSYEEQLDLMERHIKALARGKEELAILEAGCGRRWPLKLDGVKFRLTGVDLDEKALASRRDLDEAIVADLRTVDLGARKFDVVYNSYVLEHVRNAELVLENLYRWLKPGGLLLLNFPDRNTAFGFAGRFTPFWLHVAYHKYILRRWHAGKAGYGPYPTHYDRIVSRDGMRAFCASHRLEVRAEFGLCDFLLERTAGTRLALMASILVSALSFGRLPWRHNNLTYVLTKA